jgi:imidazolonepropionase-like amidohydrolase
MSDRKTDLVKVWLDDFGKSLPTKVSPEILAAVVDESHKRNLRVAVHIHDIDDAKTLLAVGGDIVAHGVRDRAVDAEFIDLMKKRKAWYIPTLGLDDSNFIYADKPEFATNPLVARWVHPQMKALISDPAWQARVKASPAAANARRALAMNKANLMTLHKAGIPIGFGSDAGVGLRIPGIAEHRELELMVEAGFTPLESLAIATSKAAKLLNLDDRGSIQTGKRADLVVLDADPLQNITNTLKVNSVWHRGVQVTRN